MAFSRTPIAALSLVYCLFLFVSLYPSPTLASDSEKVSLELYYESLCPYSANFIVNQLVKIFEDDLISIVDLKLVPYGNARVRANNTVVCQHGPYECLLNTVEACAIDAWPELNRHFPFIYCIEDLVHKRKYPLWESCFEKLGLDPKPVNDCYKSEAGKELELQYGAETDALQPPHTYVPWVVVDGQPIYEDYENFLSYICKAYKGSAAQASCSELFFKTFQMEGAKPSHSVTYKEQEKIPILWARIRSTLASWMNQMNMAAVE
ncbi:Gamma interferon inducible lysosomal thiol reductase GILT [Trema orientale]|uniref:Gamma interferon inducible lysosomal thiol reductase GILT n=1 Tax=Trema orientale TaxID=63057 RepID=A0A2P5EJZ6_TREOI|nr:Gamma interferon inducible lysosomal thiol reductase GILT [Trema orientale]